MKPLMLITGTSAGIGKACAKYFSDSYDVIGVARRAGEYVHEQGDITSLVFRDYLVAKYCPDVFINNAAVVTKSIQDSVNLNLAACGDLMFRFYDKMTADSLIINMSSLSANVSGHQDMDKVFMIYKSTKRMLKSLSNDLTTCRRRQVRVTSLEPANVDTDMGNQKRHKPIPESNYIDFNLQKYAPMPPEYIAQTIEWIIKQPPWVIIKSLEVMNSYRVEAERNW